MIVGDCFGKVIHGEAVGAGEGFTGIGSVGDDKEAPGFAEVEVMAGGFVALLHRLVGDKDEAASGFFCFLANFFLGRGDKWRNEHASISGGIKPALTAPLSLHGAVGAMHNHLLLERVVKQLKISISLKGPVADSQIVDPLEKLRMRSPDSQPSRIVPEVINKYFEIAPRRDNLVVISFLKYRGASSLIIDRHFKPGHKISHMLVNGLFYLKQHVQVIGHERILQNLRSGFFRFQP